MAPRPVQRAIAAVTAAVLVLGGLVLAWHRAEVVHGICGEHGEALHLSKQDAEHAHAQDDETRHLEKSAWIQLEGDHHCALIATFRDPVVDERCTVAPELAPAEEAPALPAGAAAPRVAAIWRLAPKTSPPV